MIMKYSNNDNSELLSKDVEHFPRKRAKKVEQKTNNSNGFFIGNNRAMISLGPLTEYKYCPYNCAFCYVKSGFNKYPNLEMDEIISFLKANRKYYNIIYISGDTDSFAPPRTNKAIELLKKISKSVDVDITFTTRTVFKDSDMERLKDINYYLKTKNKKLIASISISRLYSFDFLEPPPIPEPEKRIEQLKIFKENGMYTMLAVRPFLPIINASEYIEIIKRCKGYADAVLGEKWYADEKLINTVCKNIDTNEVAFVDKVMDFDTNKKIWKCFEAQSIVKKVDKYCKDNNIKFFMRSYPAIEYIGTLDSMY